MRRRTPRRAAAIGLAGLVLGGLAPGVSRADSANVETIALATGAAVLLAGACGGIASSRSGSANDDEYTRKGFLLNAAGTYALSDGGGGGSIGFNGGGGYRCHKYLSAEVEVEWLDGFTGDFFIDGRSMGRARVEPVVYTSNLKGYLPFERYQPFLLLGLGAMTADAQGQPTPTSSAPTNSEYDMAMRFGIGVDVYATRNIVVDLGIDYVLPFRSLESLDYFSFGWGLQYRF